MTMTPTIAIHASAAVAAIALGPLALWARRSRAQHPRLHRGFGYAWVTLMVMVAVSALFIPAEVGPTLGRFGLIHLLVPVVLFGLFGAFYFLAKGRISAHRKTMLGLYFGACVTAGVFTLAPNRFFGQLVFGQWLGLLA